jgi:membrane protein DedA with SNARE-associated domain
MGDFHQILTVAAPWLHQYGYLVLALTVLVEGTGIPLPGEILMMGAALLAGRGEMSMPLVLLTAWIAAVAGDNLGYWIGHSGGRRLLLRAGVSRRRLARFDGFFNRYGIWLILFGRFFDGTRQLNGLVAGSARMAWGEFFLADLSGAALWASVWVIGLYFLGHKGSMLHLFLLRINPWVAALALVALIITLYLLFRRGVPWRGTPHSRENALGVQHNPNADSLHGGSHTR